MPGVSGVTVVTNARVYYTPRAAAGASGARHSLRPLYSGRTIRAQLGRIAPREGGVMFSIVMPRFKRGIQYAVTSRISTNRLWNTGSPRPTGRRPRRKLMIEN